MKQESIFKAAPFLAPWGPKELSRARERSLAVGQAGMEDMGGIGYWGPGGHGSTRGQPRGSETCDGHGLEGKDGISLTPTALPGQG